ncbi:MAG: zinc ribbon domain-containing protein [Clostridia bacterium]|nr:zinc ribbon domain-containing protein [Clostridia bacterium]
MARFCTNCGAELSADSLFCGKCSARVTAPQAAPSGAYVKTRTMAEAAEIAISLNAAGKWSYWSSPKKFRNIPWNLRSFAEKEDRRLGRLGDRGGMLYYVVSPFGSLGQVYADEMNGGKPVLEWLYYVPGEGEAGLPSSPEKL